LLPGNKEKNMEELKQKIRNIPDFPASGILFRDITTLIKDGEDFGKVVDIIVNKYRGEGIDAVACIEARGFIFGGAAAYALGVGFVPIRKKGKLPAAVHSESYALEYGEDTLEVHRDAFSPGQRVLLVDDLLATGGTAAASVRLIEKAGANVAGIAFLIELSGLNGAEKLAGYQVFSILRY
jgi:adenine phosphoribosyltransferase